MLLVLNAIMGSFRLEKSFEFPSPSTHLLNLSRGGDSTLGRLFQFLTNLLVKQCLLLAAFLCLIVCVHKYTSNATT